MAKTKNTRDENVRISETAAQSKDLIDMLDSGLAEEEAEFQLETAADEASQLTEKEIGQMDAAWRRVFEKLGISEEMDQLARLERASEERRRQALDALAERKRQQEGE